MPPVIPNPSKPIFVCYYDYNQENESYRTKIINEQGTELFTKYNKIETISLNDIDTDMPYEKNVLKYERDGKYGLIDLKGNIITKAIYVNYRKSRSSDKQKNYFQFFNL